MKDSGRSDKMTKGDKGIIFDIQYNAIYDGPGIRTLVFFKGCPLRCKWCHNPESQQSDQQISYFPIKCTMCESCVKACPENALKIRRKSLSKDDTKCTRCGRCAAACDTGATELIGRTVNVSEIWDKVKRDKPFYETSGGGVTISGGEPTLQPAFLLNVLSKLKEENINTAVETCGFFNVSVIDKLLPVVDLFLFDIKHVNDPLHTEFTRVPCSVIKENFALIVNRAGHERIIPRVPLISGFNTDDESIKNIAEFIKSSGHPGPVHLMPYNRTAKTKWEKIGRGEEYTDFGIIEDEDLKRATEIFKNSGLEVKTNH